ncbi:M48 family metalloprotease [Nocardia terrae]|uniref:M48 family metalloprotease n=1 Tax=Nocardia terrae TaxID=2675851 RepID=UPI0012F90E03|nr:M48 family metalloprotease [Nocardia terrae]
MRRQALPWSIAMLLVSWPIPLLTSLLLFRLGGLIAPWAAVAVSGVWLIGGVAVEALPTPKWDGIESDRHAHSVLPRRPTPEEAEALNPAWRRLMRAIGLTESTFQVCVRDSPGPLGQAHHRGLVIMSAKAVRELSPGELRGVLGHEIGHLVGDGGGLWYRVSYWCGSPVRMPFWVAERVSARWAPRLSSRHSAMLSAAGQLGVLIGLITLMQLLFGTMVAAALTAAAAAQMLGQRAVLRRNQLNADRVSVDLGAGPGLRSLVMRGNRRVSLYPRRYRPLWVRIALWCLEASSPDPHPDRELAALEARMREGRSRRQEPPAPGWAERAGHAAFRPLRNLLLWSMTATWPPHPFVRNRAQITAPPPRHRPRSARSRHPNVSRASQRQRRGHRIG